MNSGTTIEHGISVEVRGLRKLTPVEIAALPSRDRP